MKNTFLVLIFSFFFFGCTNNINDSYKLYSFSENSKITLDDNEPNPFTKIESGENLVFKYYFQKEDNENISDDEYSESIIFEIDADLDHFSYTDEELSSINAYFNKSCFCPIDGSISIVKGTIQGTKIDNLTWEIKINITFTDSNKKITKVINASFLNTIRHRI